MAEEVVVKEQLSEAMIAAGAELTRRLSRAKWPFTASLWLYASDTNHWRLLLASPGVKSEGPRKVYEHVQNVLEGWPANTPKVSLREITVADESHPVISLLQNEIGDSPPGLRLSQDTVDGHLIEDAYIYRMQ